MLHPLDLNELSRGMTGITSAVGTTMHEAASVTLANQRHPSPVAAYCDGIGPARYALHWEAPSAQVMRAHNDLQDALELGAVGVAVLVALARTGFEVVERSRKGTGFDYWLGDESAQPFARKARLEVSGIATENRNNTIAARLGKKAAQTAPSNYTGLPVVAVVVEFSQPYVGFLQRP